MANGFPLSAITGPKEFMKIFDDLWVSSTNNSETLSLAASLSTINEMKNHKTIEHCWKIGKQFFEGWNKTVRDYNINAEMIGYPIRMTLNCLDSQKNESPKLKALILQEMIKRGIFISPGPSFISYSHSLDDVRKTLDSLEEACKFITENNHEDNFEKLLEGKLPKTIWSMVMEPIKKISG